MHAAGYIDAEKLPFDEVVRLCGERIRDGQTIVFFPEGRRTRTGALGRFHVGAFFVACVYQCPIVPMIIYNSYSVFSCTDRLFTCVPIDIELLNPVYPADFADSTVPHRAMMRHVRALYEDHLAGREVLKTGISE